MADEKKDSNAAFRDVLQKDQQRDPRSVVQDKVLPPNDPRSVVKH